MKHSTWMKIAYNIASESKCCAHKVGCVIVKDDHVVSHGYNGTPAKQPNCCDVNHHLVHNGEFQNFISQEAKDAHHEWSQYNELHAEHNAVIYADPEKLKGSVVYCTLQPCKMCSIILAGCGVSQIIYDQEYHRNNDMSAQVLSNTVVSKLSDIE